MRALDLHTLRLFLSVYEQKNLTRAAELHNTATSAVTKRIQDLEQDYKVCLFTRQSRGVEPTPAADELARLSRELFANVDLIAGAMSEFSHGMRGQVRVGASTAVLIEWLADSLADFSQAHPLIRVHLSEAMSWRVVRDLIDGRIEIGVVSTSVDIPEDITTIPYRTDRLTVAVPRQHPLATRREVAFAELLDYEHIGIAASAALTMRLTEAASQLNRTIRYAYQVASHEVARVMVARGLGIAVLTDGLVLPYCAALGLVGIPLSDPWGLRTLRICHRDRATLTVSARLFLDHLSTSQPEHKPLAQVGAA